MTTDNWQSDLPERDKTPTQEVPQPPRHPPNRVPRSLTPQPDFACIICGSYIDLPTAWFVAGVALCPVCRRTFRAEKILAYVEAFCSVPVVAVHASHHGLLFWRPRGEVVQDNILSWMTLLPGDLPWTLLAIDAWLDPQPDRIEPDVALDQNLTCRLHGLLPDRPIPDTLPV